MLDWIGYLPPVDGQEMIQSESTLLGMRVLMSLLPAGLMLAAAATLLAYPINQRLLQTIANDLKQRTQANPTS
jgi:GPH family glycoside/pentoside/hexuronide:cation symporter